MRTIPEREPPVADEKKTERTNAGGEDRPGTGKSPPKPNFFDQWVDRRLKTMHDAVLDEKIPDDMLRMLLGDAAAEPNKPERGTSDDANRPRPEGQPGPDPRRDGDPRH
jgi:hypothetical protein